MASQITFLKEIVVIMMGLSLTSAVQTFFSKHVAEGVNNNSNSVQNYLIFILILLNIIRFFYGNWMYLEKEFSSSTPKVNPTMTSRRVLLVYIIVICQSIIFSILSLQKYEYFFYTFAVILCVDVVGFILLGRSETPQSFGLERSWMLNNFFAVIIILLLFLLIPASEQRFYWCFTISSLNTIVGFILSWRFYYPP